MTREEAMVKWGYTVNDDREIPYYGEFRPQSPRPDGGEVCRFPALPLAAKLAATAHRMQQREMGVYPTVRPREGPFSRTGRQGGRLSSSKTRPSRRIDGRRADRAHSNARSCMALSLDWVRDAAPDGSTSLR
jgi:hypothetical protein